jgi:hypothetical protein
MGRGACQEPPPVVLVAPLAFVPGSEKAPRGRDAGLQALRMPRRNRARQVALKVAVATTTSNINAKTFPVGKSPRRKEAGRGDNRRLSWERWTKHPSLRQLLGPYAQPVSKSAERSDNPEALRSDFDTVVLNSRQARNFRFLPASRPLMKPCCSSASVKGFGRRPDGGRSCEIRGPAFESLPRRKPRGGWGGDQARPMGI